ncbi:hypothetical protein HDU92_005353 [Lobulomyces angularis]|nr:hypothetical protein HDU92_005353 [Lobulomyces angularis]
MSITITHKAKKFEIQFAEADWESRVTLKLLKEKCSQVTKIGVENIKLLICEKEKKNVSFFSNFLFNWCMEDDSKISGSYIVMKDDNKVLSHYNIKNDSKIVMLGDNQVSNSKNTTYFLPSNGERIHLIKPITNEPKRTQLEILTDKLLAVNEKSQDVIPLINVFESTVLLFKSEIDNFQIDLKLKKFRLERFRLNEILMKQLLELDALEVNLDSSGELRIKRKEIVKSIQNLIERVDNILKLIDENVQPI